MIYKKILLSTLFAFSVLILYAQKKMNNYEKAWKKIDSLIEKGGLPKSALKEVDKLYSLAKKENNDAQVIKALIYKMNLNDEIAEESVTENITLLEKETQTANEPAGSILKSIAAGNYWNYLQRNRHKLYSRTTTVNFKQDDVDTWSLQDLHTKISSLFISSLHNKELLKKTLLEPFDAIIIKGNARQLRPTLYDLLAHRALNYFKNDERGISKPAYAFEINDAAAFSGALQFINHTFKNDDSASLHYKALTIYQELLSTHLADVTPDALIDADIERIEFIKNYSTHPDKDELYKAALERITSEFPNNLTASRASYLLAEWYVSKARTYNPLTDSSNRYAYLKALDICNKTAELHGNSEGKDNCINLANSIRNKELNMETEKVNNINQPFRTLISYRNFTTAHFRIIKLNKAIKDELSRNTWEEKFWQKLVALPSLKSFSYHLPDTKDYQKHSTEIKIDALPSGEYALVASANKSFGFKSNVLAVQYFYVSDIAYINNNKRYYVVNRNTGAPLDNAAVQLWQRRYDYNAKRDILLKLENYTTDKDGFFEIAGSPQQHRNFRLDISYRGDRLFMDDEEYYYTYSESAPKQKDQTFLFTDRSIYRPGQIVYFKGIVVTPKTKDKDPAPVVKRKSLVKLYNANGELADSIEVVTNDYGSYSGRFTLPAGILNGIFRIEDASNHNSISINVEEYKRPKFYVEITKPAGTYRLHDTISVAGLAKSYAGNNINGAKVNYRITRRAIMPLWSYGDYFPKIWPPFPSRTIEITNGTTETDENGEFVLNFAALPDKSIDKKFNPIFQYEITADITDINGETRSGNNYVSVGYKALKLNMEVPAKEQIDSLKQIKLSSTNINDVFEKTQVNLSIYKLAAPAKKFRKRYWAQPDQFILTREEYYKLFPYDPYSDENDITKWAREKKVFDKTIITGPDTAYKLNGTRFQAGWYAIEAITKDKYGEEVKEIKYIELTDPKKEIPAKYADKGELPASRFYVKSNRFYVESLDVKSTGNEKQLSIEYTTFRDKTLPGANEKWKVKITGHKGMKVAAELLTAMYDASLDQFATHSWTVPDLWKHDLNLSQWSDNNNFIAIASTEKVFGEPWRQVTVTEYDQLKVNDNHVRYSLRGRAPGVVASKSAAPVVQEVALEEVQMMDAGVKEEDSAQPATAPANPVQPRKNLNETAFFFPDLRTDSSGNIEFSFTTPEALTEWKWMLLAHTKDLAFGYGQKSMITQKELMVQPNIPRFLREGDLINLSSKIANMSKTEITGNAVLELTDPATGETVDAIFHNISPRQFFTVKPGQSAAVNFSIKIPFNYARPVTWRIIAQAGNLSDGEESLLPVVSNRMLVTETLLLPVKGNATKSFTFEKLLKSGNSESLEHYGLTVEFTSNPSWYAIQALPYLTEGTKENAEQIFNRFYANALASKIINASPGFKEIIEQWKIEDTSALFSNLQKNEELKSVLLQETPWVLEAKTEMQQKKNIALLFDMVRLSKELSLALDKLQQIQAPSGGFVWYPGGREDRYMTQYILSGIGHLKKLRALPDHNKLNVLIKSALSYLDNQIKKDYEELKKNNKTLPTGYINNIPVQYLYMRSFFTDVNIPSGTQAAYNYYRNQAKTAWVKHSSYLRAMIALSFSRSGDVQNAQKIMVALKESSITNPELGMYWKDMSGYYWYEAPIEAQSLLIEAFVEISKDIASADDMKTWLLKNKQTNNWKTTRATADACYALLLQGSDWTAKQPEITISLGNKTVSSSAQAAEAGTGYFKTTVGAEDVRSSMGNIKVKVSSNNPASSSWGGIYWQYFEDLDKISTASTPLKLDKKLFVEKNTDRGPVLQPLDNNNTLHVGDKIKVRIELRVDRNMEYVHMKDMRGACLEPVNVLSEYKWQGGLGYYESTKDASTNFFFDYLPKGTYVFEYPLFVTHTGTFSNGITSIQCMYAPEFSSHSEGIKLIVEDK